MDTEKLKTLLLEYSSLMTMTHEQDVDKLTQLYTQKVLSSLPVPPVKWNKEKVARFMQHQCNMGWRDSNFLADKLKKELED